MNTRRVTGMEEVTREIIGDKGRIRGIEGVAVGAAVVVVVVAVVGAVRIGGNKDAVVGKRVEGNVKERATKTNATGVIGTIITVIAQDRIGGDRARVALDRRPLHDIRDKTK
mmetsp:Transcript_19770/g.46053  ORF Transcript_19770/g.46053 Transcript_19770/m.46053 type:complete len:112 (-) Transcript_19770:2-337(-)